MVHELASLAGVEDGSGVTPGLLAVSTRDAAALKTAFASH
jgi:hypothetical protein